MQTQAFVSGARIGVAPRAATAVRVNARRAAITVRAAAAAEQAEMVDDMGFKLMRKGVKVAAQESILTPRCVNSSFKNSIRSSTPVSMRADSGCRRDSPVAASTPLISMRWRSSFPSRRTPI